MSNNIRLRALTRLVQSKTTAAETALSSELDVTATVLTTQNDYEVLHQSLEILNVIGFRFSNRVVDIIDRFIRSIEGRELVYPQDIEKFTNYISKYKNAQSLIIKAIEVIDRIRYLETNTILVILLSLYNHHSDSVRTKVRASLDSIVKYDLDVYYGIDRKSGIGSIPQKEVLGLLEPMADEVLRMHLEASTQLLNGILSPRMEGVTWSSESVTISQGSIQPDPELADIRTRSIQLLCRLYKLAEFTQQKFAVIKALNEGTRTNNLGNVNDETLDMIAGNSVEVLSFYMSLISSEDYPIVQKIESNSYWIFQHSLSEVSKAAALNIEASIANNKEYLIYKTLIGFEGIFGEWSTYEKNIHSYENIETERRLRASEFASSINTETYDEWRARILKYVKTESEDLMTFPVFYYFLGEFATAQPVLALKLITEDAADVAHFLIPILSNLWDSDYSKQVRELIENWAGEAEAGLHNYLNASIKMFLSTRDIDVQLLKMLLNKASEIKDVPSLRQIVTIVIARWEVEKVEALEVLNDLLYPAIDTLTELKDASWIFDVWFRKEIRNIFAVMDSSGKEHLFRNLLLLGSITFHAEEILCSLAQSNPERVMQFLIERMAIESQKIPADGSLRGYDAIPYEFYMLQEPLSKIPRTAVEMVLKQYHSDDTLFAFRGGALLKNIFPNLSGEFETELLQLIRDGSENNIRFVLGVLRNYHGEFFTHKLCKEIIKVVDNESALLNELTIAMENTGVVSGEFGFANTYERKIQEINEWLSDPNEKVKAFVVRYIPALEQMRDAEIKRAEENIALRKHQYGED